MTKVKIYFTLSLISKISIVSCIYYAVFKASVLVGAIALLSHLTYEVFEFLGERELNKASQDAVQKLYETLTMGNGGGHC